MTVPLFQFPLVILPGGLAMMNLHPLRAAAVLALILMALPAVLLADEPQADMANPKSSDADRSTVVILGDDGEEVTITLEDGTLTMISQENGKTSTRIMDMEAVGLLAADAVDGALMGMEDVFAELEDMQFQFRMGQDNRMNLSFDDSEFELDLDQVMTQVASAVQVGLSEINTSEWASHQARWDDVSDDELRDELDSLKDEMKELRRELRRLKDQN